MSTPNEIYWALNRRRDPKMVAAQSSYLKKAP